MKRGADDAEALDQRKLKTESPGAVNVDGSEDPFDPSLLVDATTLKVGSANIRRYIAGQIIMKFPPVSGKMRLLLNVAGLKLEILLTGACSKCFRLLDFSIEDEVTLSLKGAAVEQAAGRQGYLPIVLRYQDGVVVKFVHSKKQAKINQIIDTWSLGEKYLPAQQSTVSVKAPALADWFATPIKGPSFPTSLTSVSATDRPRPEGSRQARDEVKPAADAGDVDITPDTVSSTEQTHIAGSSADSNREDARDARCLLSVVAQAHEVSADLVSTPPRVPPQSNYGADKTDLPDVGGDFQIDVDEAESTEQRLVELQSPAKKRKRETQDMRKDRSPNFKKQEKNRQRRAKRREKLQEIYGEIPDTGDTRNSTPSGRDVVHCFNHAGTANSPVTSGLAEATASLSPIRSGNDVHSLRPEVELLTLNANALPEGPAETKDISPLVTHKIPDGVPETLKTSATCYNSTPHIRTSPALPQLPTRPIERASVSPSNQRASDHPPSHTLPTRHPTVATSGSADKLVNDPSQSSTRHPDDSEHPLGRNFMTEAGVYNCLSTVPDKQRVKIMAVITSISGPRVTRTGEHSVSIRMVDPSIFETRDFTVNCFAKLEALLPQPKVGDVMLFRDIEGNLYQGKMSATGHSYRQWRWSVYEPQSGRIVRPSVQAENTIHFQPGVTELQHCMRLADWWRDVANSAQDGQESTSVYQIIAQDCYRRHRLIAEASPYAEPDGYFDCTVEVLKGFQNDNGVYSLYVTDYSTNDQLTHINGQWCPPALAQRVLKIEMWDTAAAIGPNMKPGELYCMRNTRMILSTGCSWEAKIVEGQRIRKLDEHDLDGEPHLMKLLERREEWKDQFANGDGLLQFPHLLFENVEEDKHFCCTVEVIGISFNDGQCYMYVTDYTSRPDLAPVAPSITRLAAHKDRVVKIVLNDAQAETAKNLKAGDFISIRNLRIKRSGTGQFAGRLGGDQRLIDKLHMNGDREELKALLQRKQGWEISSTVVRPVNGHGAKIPRLSTSEKKPLHVNVVNTTNDSRAVLPAPSVKPKMQSIEEVRKSDRLDCKFRIHARIVDFYPDSLDGFTVRRCEKCRKIVPDTHLICFNCAYDMCEETVQSEYHFWLGVRDQENCEMEILVCNPECSLLKGLDPVDLKEDRNAVEALARRLRPLAGPALMKYEGVYKQNYKFHKQAPMLELDVRVWEFQDEHGRLTRAFVLLHHSVLE
ncbi:hypothetical protein OBBRIDRAFT_789916 [Obba rivulosa]|uniref:Protection of telomeres protein 1 n=1 Tax=Obba rivulosa TaxID=1052685 RepID=A0A8E2J3J6_9APHY|nr:hypothetical protein OBBRIDRAFT_789916 [Obba rivulosa]